MSSIRLEQLLLQLDKVDALGDEQLRAKRKEEVKYVQHLLQVADALNSKANRLVEFQERLSVVGKQTLKISLEATQPKPNPGVPSVPEAINVGKTGERLFATGSPRAQSQQRQVTIEQKDAQNEEKNDSVEETMETESVEDVKAMQQGEEANREAAWKYHQDKHARLQDPSEDDHKMDIDSEKSQQATRRAQQQQTRSMSEIEQEPEEPVVTIKEGPRAYVMLVHDPQVHRAKVMVDREHKLNILVPGKSPVKYALGGNINAQGITKEVQGEYMRLVLPKHPIMPMRTGRNFVENSVPFRRGGYEDFWSRF